MPTVSGQITQRGLVIGVRVMQSPQRVEALKKAGKQFATPIPVQGLIDTGASCSALDPSIVRALELEPRGVISIHTPTTGPGYETRTLYDACLVIGETKSPALHVTRPVFAAELATEGFHAIVGRDVLKMCTLVYNGPSGTFTLEYHPPAR